MLDDRNVFFFSFGQTANGIYTICHPTVSKNSGVTWYNIGAFNFSVFHLEHYGLETTFWGRVFFLFGRVYIIFICMFGDSDSGVYFDGLLFYYVRYIGLEEFRTELILLIVCFLIRKIRESLSIGSLGWSLGGL